ncbi:MAG: efflux RND transporter permease subunit [Planctomycetes bacterium]|nr:efflux RND transporter permease subunit [Planctomycetota bacterium]MBI3833418.1 efflux RND transporter permease subunit [Planctomycetota bacterium]
MVPRIIEYCVRNRFIVLMIIAAVAVLGVYCVLKTPIDAIPDLSENQVIVFTDWMGRSPKEIDDQITYPLSVNLQGLAGIKAIRSSSEFNFSMINIIFDDKTDFYFARTRILERLNIASTFLPPGVVPYLAPDATALGQIFWYTLEGDGYSVDELRSIQDWYVRYQLYVAGVAEVASVGGFVREYQIDVDPDKLRAYDISLGSVFNAVAGSNIAVGGKVYFEANAEYLIRGVGWIRGVRDLENVVVAERNGVPIYTRNLAAVQLGPEYRRSMLEKNNQEAVGGVVMMRFGENPLAVTQSIKQRIEQLQAGLPPGVRIVPFYDRTRLIEGAIHTLVGTLREELIIASIAILLILTHIRSAIVVCTTLPLAVLIAFILMYYLGIPSNIMSLSGIAISIGILVDAAVVMVENATHELTKHFGHEKVHGDTTEIVVKACRLVGKPIFFAVIIMLISFLPVFSLGGQEGKMFHPLAFTKSFAMVGVAILAITFVPAIIPILIKGRLRSEEDNWIVRSFINIYKPVLTWLMQVPAAGLWFVAFLFIIGAGLVGSSGLFLGVLAVGLFFGCIFFRRGLSKTIAFALLLTTAYWSWHFPKLGREFMPPLDEGSILDMPVTVPRVSITQASDDIRVRDEIMRGFPEVDQVVGKVGRADTPTDPSGIDMVETVVSLRPKEWWPKRKVQFNDALAEAKKLLAAMQSSGYLRTDLKPDEVEGLANNATMDGMTQFDRTMREFANGRLKEFQPVVAKKLLVATVNDLVQLFRRKGELKTEPTAAQIDQLADPLVKAHGLLLVEVPRREEFTKLMEAATDSLAAIGAVERKPELLILPSNLWTELRDAVSTALGAEKMTLGKEMFERFEQRLNDEWVQRAKVLNWELEDQAGGAMVWSLLESLRNQGEIGRLLSKKPDDTELQPLRNRYEGDFRKEVFLWHKLKSDIVKEMDSELQMPGWGNIWTQPIINRVDMLATGVRTMIGVKVFGPRQEDKTEEIVEGGIKKVVVKEPGIQGISNQVAGTLRGIRGAVDVFPDQIVGRSYLQIDIDREKAARYGVNVSDIQEAIEVAMGGKTITVTVEGRRRFPVRVRYARDFWQTEEALRRILVTGRRGTAPSTSGGLAPMGAAAGMNATGAEMPAGEIFQIPITEVADIKVVEGPSVIKSENGMLRAYVQLNVRDRDIVGFVEEAQQAIAEKVKLPTGFFIEWSGQFEAQVRAKKTLQVIFPMVVLLIFVILFMTFNDFRDALLIILAVPGALVGGVIFQSLFGFNFSVAVWVGYIACFGMATQTGVIMLVYLHDAINNRGGLEKIGSVAELTEAIIAGAVHRLRPKLMTEGVAIVGLMPMLWATGVGAEVMKPMAAPVLGGLLVADEVIDLLLPVIFNWYQTRRWQRLHAEHLGSADGTT